jgi:formylglycine-generating enzyme required for sulfatase activity
MALKSLAPVIGIFLFWLSAQATAQTTLTLARFGTATNFAPFTEMLQKDMWGQNTLERAIVQKCPHVSLASSRSSKYFAIVKVQEVSYSYYELDKTDQGGENGTFLVCTHLKLLLFDLEHQQEVLRTLVTGYASAVTAESWPPVIEFPTTAKLLCHAFEDGAEQLACTVGEAILSHNAATIVENGRTRRTIADMLGRPTKSSHYLDLPKIAKDWRYDTQAKQPANTQPAQQSTKYTVLPGSYKLLAISDQAEKNLWPDPQTWPEGLWRACWQNNEWFDFTAARWMQLSYAEKVKYSKAYQLWYARQNGLPWRASISKGRLALEMVLIPPGRFWMGSAASESEREEDERRYKVLLQAPFWLQKTELTQNFWYTVTGEKPWLSKKNAEDQSDLPAVHISWDEVRHKLLPNLGKIFALPTEAQWEYACRAGLYEPFYWRTDDIGQYANALDMTAYESGRFSKNLAYLPGRDPYETLAPVAQFRPNPWGLHDMIGNVWEWCQDWYGDYPTMPTMNPRGPIDGSFMVRRGGSWLSGLPKGLRSAYRGKIVFSRRDSDLGCRLAWNWEK